MVWDIVIPRRQNDFPRGIAMRLAPVGFRADGEVSVSAVEAQHSLVLVNVELVMIRNAPVILQRLRAAGFFVERRHGDVADFEQLGSGEENEINGVVVNRVDYTALIK